MIDQMPCTVRLLPIPKPSAGFYDFEEYERLVTESDVGNGRVIALLGGEAALRCGEMLALEWDDVDLERRQLCVHRSDWRGHITTPKGGRIRHVPLTSRLAQALTAHRHLRSRLVLCQRDGSALTHNMVADHVRRAARKAHLPIAGVHRLRHTFCSHLAMRGAPTRAIQELAGHAELGTTQRYMHLSPAALDSAIRLLEPKDFGDIVETGGVEIGKSRR
jgi:integrase